MTQKLSKTLKNKIRDIVHNLTLKQIKAILFWSDNYEYDYAYDLARKEATEHFVENFEEVETDYRFLEEYYNDLGEVKNFPQMQQLCCEFINSLNY